MWSIIVGFFLSSNNVPWTVLILQTSAKRRQSFGGREMDANSTSNATPASAGSAEQMGGVLDEEAYKTLNVTLYSLVIVLGITGNALLITTIARNQSLKTPCNYLILSIAVADLCVASVATPLRIVEVFRGWPLGEFLCQFLAPLQDVFVCVSVTTHTVIAFERYRGIVTPLKPKIELSRAKQLIGVTWLGCYALVGVPVTPLLYVTPGSQCRTQWLSLTSRRIYMVYLMTTFILVPLVAQTAAYARIIAVIRAQNPAISRTGTVEQRENRTKRKAHLVKMLVILVAIFQLCYLPRGVQMLLWEFGDVRGNAAFEYADLVLFVVYYMKHVVNPIILFAMSSDFRGNCLRTVCGCCGGAGGQVASGSVRSPGTDATQVTSRDGRETKRSPGPQAQEAKPRDTEMWDNVPVGSRDSTAWRQVTWQPSMSIQHHPASFAYHHISFCLFFCILSHPTFHFWSHQIPKPALFFTWYKLTWSARALYAHKIVSIR